MEQVIDTIEAKLKASSAWHHVLGCILFICLLETFFITGVVPRSYFMDRLHYISYGCLGFLYLRALFLTLKEKGRSAKQKASLAWHYVLIYFGFIILFAWFITTVVSEPTSQSYLMNDLHLNAVGIPLYVLYLRAFFLTLKAKERSLWWFLALMTGFGLIVPFVLQDLSHKNKHLVSE